MRRWTMVGLGVAAVLSGSLVAGVAGGADEGEKDVRRPGRRVQMRLGGGGRLGISLEDVASDDVARLRLSAERGAVVTDVHEGSAAQKAGIRDGDVVLEFGGQEVWSAAQLARLVRETPAGRAVAVEVSRGGSIEKLTVVLAGPDRDRSMGFGPRGFGEDFHFEMPDLPEMPELPELADLPHPPAPPRPPMPPDFHHRFGLGQGRKLGLSCQELGEATPLRAATRPSASSATAGRWS